MVVDSNRDHGCPVDDAEPSLVTILLAVGVDLVEEGLEDLVVVILVVGPGIGLRHAILGLQAGDLSYEPDGITQTRADGGLDLSHGT